MNNKKKKSKFKIAMRNIAKMIKGKYNDFMGLSQKTKLIILIWFIVLLLLIIFIIVGSSNKKHNEDYANIENKISEAMKDYMIKHDIHATETKPYVIDTDAFISDKDAFGDKKCIGYGKAYDSPTDENDIIVNVYINCSDYTTKGYKDNR